MSALWTVEKMAAAMQAQAEGVIAHEVTGISIDTRTLKPGDAFFAIAGDARDGHDFVGAALKAGAAVAVVAAGKRAGLPDGSYLVVDDVLEGLRDLAKAARARTDAKIIGVTGSGRTANTPASRARRP